MDVCRRANEYRLIASFRSRRSRCWFLELWAYILCNALVLYTQLISQLDYRLLNGALLAHFARFWDCVFAYSRSLCFID
jgi:hypothetical protein